MFCVGLARRIRRLVPQQSGQRRRKGLKVVLQHVAQLLLVGSLLLLPLQAPRGVTLAQVYSALALFAQLVLPLQAQKQLLLEQQSTTVRLVSRPDQHLLLLVA